MSHHSAEMTMVDLYNLLGKIGPNDLLLDVRSPEEFQEGHVKGSRNIPYDEVSGHLEELQKYEKIYVYCHAGKRAQIAHHLLERAGFKNLICIGGSGMADWLEAGYPVDKK